MKKIILSVVLSMLFFSPQSMAFTAPDGYKVNKSRTMRDIFIEDYRNTNGGVIYKIDYNNYRHLKLDEKLVLNGLNCENIEVSTDQLELFADKCTASQNGSFFSSLSNNSYTVEAYTEDEKIHIVVYNQRVTDASLSQLRW